MNAFRKQLILGALVLAAALGVLPACAQKAAGFLTLGGSGRLGFFFPLRLLRPQLALGPDFTPAPPSRRY